MMSLLKQSVALFIIVDTHAYCHVHVAGLCTVHGVHISRVSWLSRRRLRRIACAESHSGSDCTASRILYEVQAVSVSLL
jgi:hypothetical protein